jgi:hypothetical protein
MSASKGKTWWLENYPASPPLGHWLRLYYQDTWLRIHSLPDAKRYADTELEYSELLHRHNAVADRVLGNGAPCFLYQAKYLGEDTDIESPAWVLDLKEYDPESEERIWIDIAAVTWQSRRFDQLLLDVANEVTRLVFASTLTGNIYAPYDGGADLIFRRQTDHQVCRESFEKWLSARADGL